MTRSVRLEVANEMLFAVYLAVYSWRCWWCESRKFSHCFNKCEICCGYAWIEGGVDQRVFAYMERSVEVDFGGPRQEIGKTKLHKYTFYTQRIYQTV